MRSTPRGIMLQFLLRWFVHLVYSIRYINSQNLLNSESAHQSNTLTVNRSVKCIDAIAAMGGASNVKNSSATLSAAPIPVSVDHDGNADVGTGIISRSLEQWKAALDRAECLCNEMINMGLPSCCTTADLMAVKSAASSLANPLVPTPEALKVTKGGCCPGDNSNAPALTSTEGDGCCSDRKSLSTAASMPSKSCCSSATANTVEETKHELNGCSIKAKGCSEPNANGKGCCSSGKVEDKKTATEEINPKPTTVTETMLGSKSCTLTGRNTANKVASGSVCKPLIPTCSNNASKEKCSPKNGNQPALSGSNKLTAATTVEPCVEGCCSSLKNSETRNYRSGNETKGWSDATSSLSSRCDAGADTCCEKNAANLQPTSAFTTFIDDKDAAKTSGDLERGENLEHVTLQVTGMTCTGCERKLKNVLSDVPGVLNLKTSLVLGRAEFDIASGTTADEVASLLERQTEFKCAVNQAGHQLDVIVPEMSSAGLANQQLHSSVPLRDIFSAKYPSGVQSIQILDSRGRLSKSSTFTDRVKSQLRLRFFPSRSATPTARITYDPKVIGARELLQKRFDEKLSLAPLDTNRAVGGEIRHLRETFFMTLLSAVLTIPVLVMAWGQLPERPIAYGSASLVLATLVQVVVAGPFYPKALKALLFSGMIEMDLLIVISTTTAWIYSVVAFAFEVSGKPLSTGEFFETSTLLVTLIMFGRLASAYARRKAAESISIQAMQPSTALLYEDGREVLIDVREFQYGDLFKVLPESVVPTDGIIVSGETEIDESTVTGEAVPVPKFAGSRIIAGSVNGSGTVLVQLRRLPIDNTISKIASMVDAAKLSRPKVQEIADRVASYFVPFILLITVIVFGIWMAVGFAVRTESTSTTIVTAITYALAALIVSCPCAIGLAVPMVMVIAGGVGAKQGVVIQDPAAIENARNATHVVFDKTGTLTEGKFEVVTEIYRESDTVTAASMALKLASSSKHPVSQGLVTHLASTKTEHVNLENVTSVIGKGMQATFKGQMVKGGSPMHTDTLDDSDVQLLLGQGLTVFCLRYGNEVLAVYGLRDALRTDAKSVISALQARNIHVSIVSGDSSGVVFSVAKELGIPTLHAKGQCSPEDKGRYLSSLSATNDATGKGKIATTIFCGDGSNDAVALAQADIGINMAGGTDLAKSAADVVLTRASTDGVLVLMDLSRASMRRVLLNFTWSFVYNLFAILLAAGAFVDARISPTYAGLGELVSVLPVIAIALHLRWVNFRSK